MFGLTSSFVSNLAYANYVIFKVNRGQNVM